MLTVRELEKQALDIASKNPSMDPAAAGQILATLALSRAVSNVGAALEEELKGIRGHLEELEDTAELRRMQEEDRAG